MNGYFFVGSFSFRIRNSSNVFEIYLVQQLIDKTNREKANINDLQQKLSTVDNLSLVPILSDISMLNVQELYENEQLIVNENKLLEVGIFFFLKKKFFL